ncbi:heparinase II/III family protein [Eubacteriales bacterium DFI.9.88]|nr:heparinase II/III family protein [Eubacteriales bacterium DFI.9.88]
MKDYFSSYVRANIKASADFCAYLCRPSGNLLNTGDSSIDNNRRKYDIRARKLGSESYLFSATQGKEGKPPERASIIYPKSGYYFYKQDHNSCVRFTDATWKMFKSGYSSRTHKHADDLSFAMYSRGYDIFSDTGYYNYNPGNAYCDYFKSSKAHNTVIVDGGSYSTENENTYKVGVYDYELTDQYDHIIGYNDMYEDVSIDRHFYSLHDVTVLYDNIMAKGAHTYTQVFHLSEHMKIVDKSNRQVLMQIKDTEYMVRIKQYGKQKCMLEEIRGEENEDMADREIQGGYISYAQNEVTAATTLHFSISGDNVDFITVITVEDKEGKSIYHNPYDKYIEKISYDKFVYNEESHSLLFGENKIKLDARKRKNLDAVAVKISERQIMIHDMERSIDEGCEYEYELIRADTGLIFYKKVYSNNDKCISELPENDVLVKGKLRRNGKEICKKMIAYIKYDSKLKEHYLDTSNYPFLNLIYKGQHIEKIEEEGYTFIVDIEYSLNYKIKWYVYRNGVYEFVTLTENLNTFTYYFKKAGSYTVSYYIMTGSGENQMYSFKRIMIKEH